MSKRKLKAKIRTTRLWLMYFYQLISLSENTFTFKNFPKTIDLEYVNKTLVRNGSIAFYYDEDLEQLVALPYVIIGKLNIYGKPRQIQCIAPNGFKSKTLKTGEFVIMYDNTSYRPIYYDLREYADRLTDIVRTRDVNLKQQKTPRILQVPEEKRLSIINAIEQVDDYEDCIYGYDNLNVDGIDSILSTAPFLLDKLDTHFNNIWAEAMRFIGISQLSYVKKERMITDEVEKTQGGNIASRYSRFNPRKKAVDKINELFSAYLDSDIEVEYYDSEPTTDEEMEVDVNE